MKDPRRDLELAAAIAATRPQLHDDEAMRALNRRIRAQAGLALLFRRHRTRSAVEYFLMWSRMLLPLGVVCAAASIVILAFAPRRAPSLSADDVLVDAVATRGGAQQLIDYGLREQDHAATMRKSVRAPRTGAR